MCKLSKTVAMEKISDSFVRQALLLKFQISTLYTRCTSTPSTDSQTKRKISRKSLRNIIKQICKLRKLSRNLKLKIHNFKSRIYRRVYNQRLKIQSGATCISNSEYNQQANKKKKKYVKNPKKKKSPQKNLNPIQKMNWRFQTESSTKTVNALIMGAKKKLNVLITVNVENAKKHFALSTFNHIIIIVNI